MSKSPYRDAADVQPEETESSDVEKLGVHRLTSTPQPLKRSLIVASASCFTLLVGGGVIAEGRHQPALFVIVAAFGFLAFVVLAWSPLQRRRLRVDLYDRGLMVSRGDKREIVSFEDVDEVWMTMDPIEGGIGRVVLVPELRLILHDGSSRRVPTNLGGGAEIMRAVTLHCSHPLQAQANDALISGETLTFGAIKLDRTSIHGPRWAARWDEISLVRCTPDRLCLFRKQQVFPWRTLRLDRVPHPTVFVKLVMRCARKVEVDDSFLNIAN